MMLVITALLLWAAAWAFNRWIASMPGVDRIARLLSPLVFGITVLVVWELVVRGLGVPEVILPPVSSIATRFVDSAGTLWIDFVQTVIKGALSGYLIGCGAAIVTAIAVDRSVFLRRGLLPVGNFVAALPIVGMAPILVMWFGFDWQSKAAVVVVMVFFPMLVNTVQGLGEAQPMQRDLMRTYAAGVLADAGETSFAGRRAIDRERPEDLCDAVADRSDRGRIFRLARAGDGIPHLDRGRPAQPGHGLGGNSGCCACRFRILRYHHLRRADGEFLASVSTTGLAVTFITGQSPSDAGIGLAHAWNQAW